MKLGIRAHDINYTVLKDLSADIKKQGFEYVQLVPFKCISDYEDKDYFLNAEEATRIKNEFAENDIKVAMLGAYFNPVHSNKAVLDKAVSTFKNYLQYASFIGANYVGTETGSYNDDEWTFNPRNRTENAYREVLAVFKDLAAFAEKNNVNIAIEGAFAHVIHSPRLLRRLIDDINSPSVYATVDLLNYLDITNYQKQREIFAEALALLRDKIVIFHLKDFIIENNAFKEVALGDGFIDYDYIIPEIKKSRPDAYLIFEGITGENINKSQEFITSLLAKD